MKTPPEGTYTTRYMSGKEKSLIWFMVSSLLLVPVVFGLAVYGFIRLVWG